MVALAVADGHGTSAYGDVGARLAVEVAVDQLLYFGNELGTKEVDLRAVHQYANHPLRVQMVREWVDRVRQHSGEEEVDLQAYGSTLLFALATPSYLLLGQLGDGDTLMVDSERGTIRPIQPDPQNFADETASLCLNEAWMSLRLHSLPPPEGEALLLLTTDGYSKSYATDEIFELIGPDYLEMFREVGAGSVEQQLPEILQAVSAGGSGDDVALGALYWPKTDDAKGPTGDSASDEGVQPSGGL